MAPLTRSDHYEIPEFSLGPSLDGKNVYSSNYAIHLANSDLPRLLTFKNKSGQCYSCHKTSITQACADCKGMVFYCNENCQSTHWPLHKEECEELKEQLFNEICEERDIEEQNQVTEYLSKVILSDYKCLSYKKDPKLSVKIDDSATFGDFFDVAESSDSTIRSFHPGTYKCTSVIPDDSCAPVTIYHHETIDPTKVMKQCILMSKDLFKQSGVPNQTTMPEWCTWGSADEEFIPSDTESEADSEASESDFAFARFVVKVFDGLSPIASDSEDQEYDSLESESDDGSSDDYESSVSDHEVEYLISESKHYLKNLPQKRQSIAADMDVTEDSEDDGVDSEVETFKDFKERVLSSGQKYASDSENSDYLPYEESDSDSGESIPDREVSDSEKGISDNEVEIILEASQDIRDMKEELYDMFVGNVYDRHHIEESDAEDKDYTPSDEDSASSDEDEISDSEEKILLEESKDLIKNLSGKRQSYQTEFSSSESESDSEVSSEGELYEDFKIHTEAKHSLSDSEDVEYIPHQADSDVSSLSSEGEMEISDAESDAVVNDSMNDVIQVAGHKRKIHPSEDEDAQESDYEAEMESDDELYNDFRSKLIVSDPSKVQDLGGSDDEEFVPAADSQDSQDESQDESQDSQEEKSPTSDDEMDVSDNEIQDLELSSEEELYEEFKDEVCKTQRRVKAQNKPKSIIPSDNKELIYFMNSQYTESLKDMLDSKMISPSSEITGSFILKNGPDSSGIAVEMKGQTWRSAYAFEDTNSGKCFALVITTDTWEHISNHHKHLKSHFPAQKWSSIAETNLQFEMKNFVC